MFGPSVADALLALVNPTSGAPQHNFLDGEEMLRFDDARQVLSTAVSRLEAYKAGQPSTFIDIGHLSADSRALLESMLNQGEISIRVGELRMQETAMQGLWMVEGPNFSGIEVGEVPAAVRQEASKGADTLAIPTEAELPEGTMNILTILHEIQDVMARPSEDGASHEINLTLLPVTPVDHQVLNNVLGMGGVDILSRGYGNCRVVSCGARNVWRANFFNSDDKMILDVIHVGDVPVAARATSEDIADSAERLRDLLTAYFPV